MARQQLERYKSRLKYRNTASLSTILSFSYNCKYQQIVSTVLILSRDQKKTTYHQPKPLKLGDELLLNKNADFVMIFVQVNENPTKGAVPSTGAVARGHTANIQNVKLPKNTRKEFETEKTFQRIFSDGEGWTR